MEDGQKTYFFLARLQARSMSSRLLRSCAIQRRERTALVFIRLYLTAERKRLSETRLELASFRGRAGGGSGER